MKAYHFLLSLNPVFGGPTASVPIQCVGLQKEDVDVTLVTYSESKPFIDALIKCGVNVDMIEGKSSKVDFLLRLSLKKFLKKENNADIYHSHGVWLPSNHWTAVAARKTGKKYVINPRGDLEVYRLNYNKWKKIKKEIIWRVYGKNDVQNAACIIATSQQEANAVRKLSITTPIAIIPNGIDVSAFPSDIVREPHEKKVLLFLSRVNPIKGLEPLIEAWSKLSMEVKQNWELHIAGNSDPVDYIHKLEEKINSLGLSDSVKLLGPITGNEKMKKYMNSDLFILPTFNENFGNVIAEAMMCECPVITTTNAPWDVLQKEKCGWWINLSVENLINTLSEAMAMSDEERHVLGKMSRKCIIENFSSENVAKKTKEVYEWVMGLREKPTFVDSVGELLI